MVDGDSGRLSFQLPELSVAASFRHRLPWSKEQPNSAGPEGWLQRTGLLPLHYFVVRAYNWTSDLSFPGNQFCARSLTNRCSAGRRPGAGSVEQRRAYITQLSAPYIRQPTAPGYGREAWGVLISWCILACFFLCEDRVYPCRLKSTEMIVPAKN